MFTRSINGPEWLLLGRSYTYPERLILSPMMGLGPEWYTQDGRAIVSTRELTHERINPPIAFTVVGEKTVGFIFPVGNRDHLEPDYYIEYSILLLNEKTYLLEKSQVLAYRKAFLKYATIVDI